MPSQHIKGDYERNSNNPEVTHTKTKRSHSITFRDDLTKEPPFIIIVRLASDGLLYLFLQDPTQQVDLEPTTTPTTNQLNTSPHKPTPIQPNKKLLTAVRSWIEFIILSVEVNALT